MSESGIRRALRATSNPDIMNVDPAFEASIDVAMAAVATDQPKTFRQRIADVVTQARLVRDVAQKMLAAAEAQVASAEAAARELEQ